MNKDNWREMEMTPEHVALAARVEKAVCDEINLLAREGVPPPILLHGLFMAAASLITCQLGLSQVPHWFERQAQIVRENLKPRPPN